MTPQKDKHVEHVQVQHHSADDKVCETPGHLQSGQNGPNEMIKKWVERKRDRQ